MPVQSQEMSDFYAVFLGVQTFFNVRQRSTWVYQNIQLTRHWGLLQQLGLKVCNLSQAEGTEADRLPCREAWKDLI